jgi:NAD(P)-dependent dehydrogenase (short-subunit alcohol dehydrogenase family)
MPKFSALHDIPNLAGRVCLVTGGSSGLGEATIKALAQHNPDKVYLAARSKPKTKEALLRIKESSPTSRSANIEILDMDLASFDSIKAAAARINEEAPRLDIVHLNAGIAMIPAALTEDGYEVQFGTNYLGHALLTQLLMPKLLQTAALPGADVRV